MTTEKTPLSSFEEDAFALTRSAVALSEALETGDQAALAAALDENLNLWTAIKTLVERDDCNLPQDIRDNLARLGDYTAKVTFDLSKQRRMEKIEVLVNTNLQIAEGLLEGGTKAKN
jgi:flagellar biosynthesis regulator FlaF